jgi:TIR domain/SIR2-like domain
MAVATIGAMRDEDWTSLTASIESAQCILMLGPEAFVAEFDGEVLPVRIGLARYVKEQLGPSYDYLDPNNPWSVAQAAIATEDINTVVAWTKAFYEKYDTESDALKCLASLPFPLVINTSVGLSAERAFKAAKADTFVDFYDRTSAARNGLPDPAVDAPVVYNLFGTLEHPGSMILSENDRFDFLISIISESPPLPTKLISTLADPKRSFLFLGFNLGQWQLRMLMYAVLQKVQRQNKSFALELEPDDLDRDAVLFYQSGHKVHFVDLDLPTLTSELRTRVQTTPVNEAAHEAPHGSAPWAPPAPAPPSDAPTVFMCHAHEDAQFAAELSRQLRANQINVWLDKDSLRGGDDWDAMIEQTLRDVQYVVVLQSAGLKAKDVGYVNKEIKLAIDKQEYYRPPRIFLIPTIIDSVDNLLPTLSNVQFVDVTTADGVDELVRTIKRDVDIASRSR